jgi:hypothetical protein
LNYRALLKVIRQISKVRCTTIDVHGEFREAVANKRL